MLISAELNKALNEQIGHELGACLQYLSIAAYFEQQKLKLLANLFFKQSDEEKEHALKFVHYVLDTKGDLQIPADPGAQADVRLRRGGGRGGAEVGSRT